MIESSDPHSAGTVLTLSSVLTVSTGSFESISVFNASSSTDESGGGVSVLSDVSGLFSTSISSSLEDSSGGGADDGLGNDCGSGWLSSSFSPLSSEE